MKKLFKWIGIIALVFFVLALVLPFVFKDKIVSKIKEETNKSLNAKVDFGDFDLPTDREATIVADQAVAGRLTGDRGITVNFGSGPIISSSRSRIISIQCELIPFPEHRNLTRELTTGYCAKRPLAQFAASLGLQICPSIHFLSTLAYPATQAV